jgi:hypothetical protein
VTVALCCVIAALVLLLVLQASHHRGQAERLGRLETWAQERDPESWGIYPDLEPEPPAPDCEASGSFHVAVKGSSTCQNCPAELSPTRP